MFSSKKLQSGKGRGEEKAEKERVPGSEARHRVVEAVHSWINRFRRLLVRRAMLCDYGWDKPSGLCLEMYQQALSL